MATWNDASPDERAFDAMLALRPTRVYVASPLSEKPRACTLAVLLSAHGYDVVSTWHVTVPDGATDPAHDELEARRRQALQCLADLDRCDVVVVWTGTGTPRGTLVEVGYAARAGAPIVWIQGAARAGSNLFDAIDLVIVVEDASDAGVLAGVDEARAKRSARPQHCQPASRC